MTKTILAVILGTLTLMVTGFIFWGTLSESMGIVRQVGNEDVVREALREASTDDGAFFVPMEGFGNDEFFRRHNEGPVAMVYLRPDGTPTSMGGMMAKGFFHFLLSAAFAVWMLKSFVMDHSTFGRRFLFLFALGLFTAIVAHPANRIWWHYPTNFTIFSMAANAGSWAATGAVMAAVLKPDN